VSDLTPAEARSLALDWAVRSAVRASSGWFVIPPQGGDPATLVVPMADRAAYLAELGGPGAPEVLSLVDTAGYGWPELRGTLPDFARIMSRTRTGRASLEPWPLRDGWPGLLGDGCRINLEFWESAPDGRLCARP
jgi:hypothetical protein